MRALGYRRRTVRDRRAEVAGRAVDVYDLVLECGVEVDDVTAYRSGGYSAANRCRLASSAIRRVIVGSSMERAAPPLT
jgi:hypothetical protein